MAGEPTIVIVSPDHFNITEAGDDVGNPIGRHKTIAIRAGENIVPARLRDHWAFKAHKCIVKE